MRTLKVQGKGSVSLPPDTVVFSFEILAEHKEYSTCHENLNRRVAELRQELGRCGIDRAEVKTSDYRIQVKNRYENGRSWHDGYTARHHIRVETPFSQENINRVLSTVGSGVSGTQIALSFTVNDKDAVRKLVLEDAVRKAKTNAETLAAAAGVRLGALVQMEYGWLEVRYSTGEYDCCCESGESYDPAPPNIDPEDVKAEDSVTLIYEIQ